MILLARRFAWVAALASTAAGCVPSLIEAGPNVTRPAVASYVSDYCAAPAGMDFTAYDFLVAGIGESRRQCAVFLTDLVNFNRGSRLADSTVATAGAQTTIALLAASTTAYALPIAAVAASTEFVRKVISGFAREYGFADFAHEIAPKVTELMNAFLRDEETRNVILEIQANPVAVSSFCLASDLVRSFSSYCSPVVIDSQIRSAIANASVERTGTGPARGRSLSGVRSLRARAFPGPAGFSAGLSHALPHPTFELSGRPAYGR